MLRMEDFHTHFFDNKLASFDVISVHLLHCYLHRVRIFELHYSASARFIILIRKELYVCYLADFGPEQIFEILPTKVIWNV